MTFVQHFPSVSSYNLTLTVTWYNGNTQYGTFSTLERHFGKVWLAAVITSITTYNR